MTAIINGHLKRNELTTNSMGGTELMAMRMIKTLDHQLLKHVNIIHSRVRPEYIDKSKKNILVLNDLPDDPESAHLADEKLRKRFDKIVCVSNWQMQYYNMVHGIPYAEMHMLSNGIEPIDVPLKKSFNNNKVKLIYHTTPHRGLEILVPVFEYLAKQDPDIHLDVYSSFSIYGWSERDRAYQELFDKCKQHDQITYHGARPNKEVREALQESHIFAYPSIWPETFCLAAVEAMSAKNFVVCPNYAALPEVTGKWARTYQWSEDKNMHANRFAQELMIAIHLVRSQQDMMHNLLEHQKAYYDNFYNWPGTLTDQWNALLKSLLPHYK